MRTGLLLSVVVLLGCSGGSVHKPPASEKGTSIGNKTTQSIGTAGGTVKSSDGRIELIVPAGALTADTVFGIEPMSNTAPGGIGTSYQLTPEGQVFAMPATVSIAYEARDWVGSSEDAMRVAYQSDDGFWHTYKSVTKKAGGSGGGRLEVQTKHLSTWSNVLGWQLLPAEARVATLGQLDLHFIYCAPEEFEDVDGTLTGLTSRCDLDSQELPRLVTMGGWSVNGTSGGSLAVGVISSEGRDAKYTAPDQTPTSNPVAVSVAFQDADGASQAVSNITVGAAGWRGTISWTVMGNATETMGMYTRTYTVSGSGNLKVGPTPSGATLDYEMGSRTHHSVVNEVFANQYTAAGCMFNVMQTRVETLDGTTSDVSELFGFITKTPAMISLALPLPQAATMGHIVVDASETQTGPGCTAAMPTHTDTPSSSAMPTDTLSLSLALPTNGRLNGSHTVHVEGMPPRDYTVTLDLTE